MRHSDFAARRVARTALMALVLLGGLTPSDHAAAQPADPGSQRKGSGSDPCQAPAQDQSKADGKNNTGQASPDLERCNGVLTPPKTGDKQIEKPAPATGTMPVIPPGDVPQQPPGGSNPLPPKDPSK